MSTLFLVLGVLILLNVALLIFSVNRIDKREPKKPVRNTWISPHKPEVQENTRAA